MWPCRLFQWWSWWSNIVYGPTWLAHSSHTHRPECRFRQYRPLIQKRKPHRSSNRKARIWDRRESRSKLITSQQREGLLWWSSCWVPNLSIVDSALLNYWARKSEEPASEAWPTLLQRERKCRISNCISLQKIYIYIFSIDLRINFRPHQYIVRTSLSEEYFEKTLSLISLPYAKTQSNWG